MTSPGDPPTCAALTRWMAIFLLLNAFVLSGVLWLAAPSGEIGSPPVPLKQTVLHHTWDLLHARGGDDSWGIIAAALDYGRAPHTTPLYRSSSTARSSSNIHRPPSSPLQECV